MSSCDYLSLVYGIEQAFQTGKTPLIIDSSFDQKVCTFFSYQTDMILLEAKTMIMMTKNRGLLSTMEYCRIALVNAMKYGKTLVINMSNSSPNFKEIYCDENLQKELQIKEDSKEYQQSYFPKEVLVEGGR